MTKEDLEQVRTLGITPASATALREAALEAAGRWGGEPADYLRGLFTALLEREGEFRTRGRVALAILPPVSFEMESRGDFAANLDQGITVEVLRG